MDLYKILEVDRNASVDEIKSAYRKLASKYHPDRGGDTRKFQEIQGAYDTLSDPQKRAAYDQPHPEFMSFHATGNPFHDIFNQFMHANQHRQRIYTITVFVTLEQIATGSTENVQINGPQGSKLIQIKIPPNIEDGSQVRYENILPDGLLQVLFRIYQHPVFKRQGMDLYTTHEINIFELITGTSLIIKDIYGQQIDVNVPPMTKPGAKLRIPNRGLGKQGDHYILIEGKLPDKISPETLSQIRKELERK